MKLGDLGSPDVVDLKNSGPLVGKGKVNVLNSHQRNQFAHSFSCVKHYMPIGQLKILEGKA